MPARQYRDPLPIMMRSATSTPSLSPPWVESVRRDSVRDLVRPGHLSTQGRSRRPTAARRVGAITDCECDPDDSARGFSTTIHDLFTHLEKQVRITRDIPVMIGFVEWDNQDWLTCISRDKLGKDCQTCITRDKSG